MMKREVRRPDIFYSISLSFACKELRKATSVRITDSLSGYKTGTLRM
jgi:hypothetical protein